MPRPWTTQVLLLFFVSLVLTGCGNPRSEKQALDGFNAILITVDTLRADHLESYGYSGVRTPAINKLAADGVVFRQDIAQVPLTIPSHCSILTGLWPNATGVRDQAGFRLAPDKVTLAKALQAAGWQTAAFIGSSILNSETGLGQGFDTYTNVTGGDKGPAEEGLERRGDQVMADALRWIETPGRARFFVWIHLFDPHTPYAAPEPYRTQYARTPYDGEIAYVDSLIGQLTGSL
ncbi:MAG: sulfatase, partial [Bryobacteraceae bacterium]